MRNLVLPLVLVFSITFLNAQRAESPYEWDWVVDGIWTGAALGGTVGGFMLIQDKNDIEPEEFAKIENDLQGAIDDINFIDRWAAGNNSESANKISDIPFAISFAAPFAMLFDDEINDHTGQYVGLYIESLATTAAMWTITAGLVDRSRPYVYDDSGVTSPARRQSNNGQRSFYSGHVAATATATFFAAKAYADFNPDSPGKVWVWTGAAVLPAAVGVFRIEAGQHFLTDTILGYALGAGVGILVPELHKKKNKNFEVTPVGGINRVGDKYSALSFRYRF